MSVCVTNDAEAPEGMSALDSPATSMESTPPGASSPGQVREEQVRLLFRFSLIGYLATLLVVFILGAILWEDLARPLLFAWFVAISAITVGRYALYKVFINREPPATQLRLWERRFLVGSFLTALCWATIATVLLPDSAHLAQRLTVVMLITLLVTGAVGYYAPHPHAFKISAFVGLMPFALSLGFSGDRIQMFLSGAILLLAGVLPYVHEKLNQALVDSLAMRHDRAMLSGKLEVERVRVRQANDALAEEMVERLKAQQAELLSAQKLRMHVERTPLAVIEWNREHSVTAWNPAAEAIFGFPEREAIGRSATQLIVPAANAAAVEAMWMELAQTRDGTKVAFENVTRAGNSIHCEWYNTPLVDPGGRVVGFASLVQDVTERLNTERTIHYMAHHDALTGLPNRRLMQDRLNQAIMQARRKQRHVAVLFLDLDRFKLLNDTLGHESGDYILKDVARRITACVREIDTVSREGGDEFVVIVPDLEHPENAQVVADKILREFAKPVEISGQKIHITTSIGISYYPNDSTDVNHLLKHADSAMYQAKDAGRNTVRFYTSDLNYLLSRRLEVEGRLRKAIELEEFFMRYQPQVDLVTGRIIGMEALIRWNDPVKGEVMPGDFIPVAEELGLIVPLGEWAFRTACHQLTAWATEGITDVAVSVNLSARQFMSRTLVPSLLAIVRDTGADPRRIEVEITETMAMRNLEQSIEILAQLRAVGMGVAVDDFGVGYSSLGQLKRLPATELKIDRSFIANVPEDSSSGSITEAIIAMAKRLKLRVMAEGVETRQQLEFLRDHRCDAFQGYLFSKPLTALEASAMLRAQAGGAGWRHAAAE
ncbi:MAG: EAL domain-containing protein [Betaproteobacteria bacterium]|nr:EAL domain-containing protein [Betaproteobacteria bacterium]